MNMKFKFTVKWDGADKSVPKKFIAVVDVDDDIDIDNENELADFLSDWLSDEYGYCHNGFDFKKIETVKEKLERFIGDTIETNLHAIIYKNDFYYVNFVDFDTEEIFCFDGANDETGSNFFTFKFEELDGDDKLKLFTLKEIK